MKKNKALRTAIALLIIVVVSTCGMTGALAKYITGFEGEASIARAGLFLVKIDQDGEKIKFKADPTVTLYEEIATIGTLTPEGNATKYAGSSLDIIVPGSILRLTAQFDVVNYSEVDVYVSVDPDNAFEVALGGLAAGVPSKDLKFCYEDDTTANTPGILLTTNWLEANDADLAKCIVPDTADPSNDITGKFFIEKGTATTGKTRTFTMTLWVVWPFSGTDEVTNPVEKDTEIGLAQAAKLLTDPKPSDPGFADVETDYELSAGFTILAEQVD